jgi:hypothetical protein
MHSTNGSRVAKKKKGTNGSSRARTVWIWSEREADEEAGDSSFVCLFD